MPAPPMPTRRTLLAGAAALAALPKIPFARAEGAPAFVACCKRAGGDFAAAVLDADGKLLFTADLDARGHDAAVDRANGRAVVFARRPGTFAVVIDIARRTRTLAFAPPDTRVFAGHGAFTPDGRLLFATEEDFDGERGVMGVYDATNRFRRIGEFPTGGIGPHEAMLLADGRTLAVANGGLLTHPDFPRLNLNVATMRPSFALIDTATGDLLAEATLRSDLHKLSIRHLAEAADGSVWFGGQYEGAKTDSVALVGRFERERGLALVEADPEVWRGMAQYVGSVAASRDGSRIAATSPRGGTVVEFAAASARVVRVTTRADAGGVAGAGDGFLVTTGGGEVLLPDGERHDAVAWDNHVRRLA